jgi:NADH-quinone oxidoreductase subunit H
LNGILPFLAKTIAVLLLMTVLQTLLTRLRIDQTVGMWWRFGTILVLVQILLIIILRSNPL